MKKIISITLAVCLLFGLTALLTACGEPDAAPLTPAQTAPQTPAAGESAPEAQAPSAEEPAEDAAPSDAEQAPEASEVSEPEAASEPENTPSALELALTFVDQDVSGLIAALGEPQEQRYEDSCSGPGEDGIWIYDDVTVFTYREGGTETVVDAE